MTNQLCIEVYNLPECGPEDPCRVYHISLEKLCDFLNEMYGRVAKIGGFLNIVWQGENDCTVTCHYDYENKAS